ncbi:hypothetical protein B0H17DRAFT_1029895 [Mycena rosella]|uniref:Secreted protein n=1 Tax=Mycena rosella TaxID=1033263 RepID=A0AAD7MC17_MYCRO|nr:hypothetical protein B0H17DRAFT_1029895 [Mycena rosella]
MVITYCIWSFCAVTALFSQVRRHCIFYPGNALDEAGPSPERFIETRAKSKRPTTGRSSNLRLPHSTAAEKNPSFLSVCCWLLFSSSTFGL